MVSRATHYTNKRRHSQREFGQEKPRLMERDEGTAWIGAAATMLREYQGATFNAEHALAVAVHEEPGTRLTRLRTLSRNGVLRMHAHREHDRFIEYRWTITA